MLFVLNEVHKLVNAYSECSVKHFLFMLSRTLESLCQELVEQGLLKLPNDCRMQDYLGKTVCL